MIFQQINLYPKNIIFGSNNKKSKFDVAPEMIKDYRTMESAQLKKELEEYVKTDTPMLVIAKLYKTSVNTLYELIERFNITSRNKSFKEFMDKNFLQMVKEGRTLKEIVKASGLSKTAIRNYTFRTYGCSFKDLKKHKDIDSLVPKPTKFEKEQEEAIKLYETGCSADEIAKQMNISKIKVRKYISKIHPAPRRREIYELLAKRVPSMIRGGFSMRTMSSALGIHFTTIARWIEKNYGMKFRELKKDFYPNLLKIKH